MADRVTLADGTALDMLDPESIRAYCRRTLAMNVDPSSAQLARIEMLEAHAAALEAKQPKPEQTPASLDDLAAARERLRQARLAERRGK